MTQSLVKVAVDLLNYLPSKNSIYDTKIPSAIAEGRQKMDIAKNKIKFGSYLLVYAVSNNTMK